MRRVEEQDANFVLIVLSASQTVRNVDIQVHIDGKRVVDEAFSSEAKEAPRLSIPPHKAFQFRLAPGTHTLTASTTAGKASLEERFELTADKRWALLGYESSSGTASQPPSGRFTLTLQDTPIYFQ